MDDFNIPSAERVALLERLQEAMGDVPPYFWASCQVCDLKALEKLVDIARISPETVRLLAGDCYRMSKYWSSHPGTSSTSKNGTPTQSKMGSSPAISSPPAKRQKISDSPASKASSSPVLRRNKRAADLAERRDKFRCVLTGDGATEIAHIYPFHSISSKEEDIFGVRHKFWDQLKLFWPEEKVAAWQAELFPEGIDEYGVERVYNLITLTPNAHKIWDRGAFALKPMSLSEDNTILKVLFFWQRRQMGNDAAMSLLTMPFSTEGLDQNEGAFQHASTTLYDKSGNRIKSGDIVEFHTDDPTQTPLPSYKLLEMQWFLQRVAGMAGAAGDYDEEWEEDEDEDVPQLELDEMDTSLLSIDHTFPESPELRRERYAEETKGSGEWAGEGVGGPEIM